MRCWIVLLAASLLGCSHSATKILPEEGEYFSDYHQIGIPAFADSHGQGNAIADSLAQGLQSLTGNEPVNRAALEQALAKYKVRSQSDLGVETLEQIHAQAPVDAIIFGKMAPDWSAAKVIMMDARMGVPVFQILAKPSKRAKVFSSPQDISQEILHAISKLPHS